MKLFFVALFGFLILVVMGVKQSKLEAQSFRSPRPNPIGRYEFPQDGVVCYRTIQGTQGVAISCVKVL